MPSVRSNWMSLTPRWRVATVAGASLASVGLCAATSGLPADVQMRLSNAAAAWLGSLDKAQRSEALYGLQDQERFDLRLAPILLEGLRRDEMSDSQWQGWRAVLAEGLSPPGLAKVEAVMSLERELAILGRGGFFGSLLGGFITGEERYYVALFGEPAPDRVWGSRFDGHHVSLNWTVMPDGKVAATPVFLGSQPREIPKGLDRAGLRVLREEEDAGLALWQALDETQRTKSELPFAAGSWTGNRPLFVGEGGEPLDLAAPVGISYAEMAVEQKQRFDELLGVYVAGFAKPLREVYVAKIDAAGRGALHFSWAGSLQPGKPGYYRIQGPTLLIEFDNTLEAADHVHTIVRDLDNDFGRDLLAEHYARHHRVASRERSERQ